jgi:hypothetical protein
MAAQLFPCFGDESFPKPIQEGKPALRRATTLTAVPIQTIDGALRAGRPARVLETPYVTQTFERPYDVSPDGQRFLMIKAHDPAHNGQPSGFVVFLNWTEELGRSTADR